MIQKGSRVSYRGEEAVVGSVSTPAVGDVRATLIFGDLTRMSVGGDELAECVEMPDPAAVAGFRALIEDALAEHAQQAEESGEYLVERQEATLVSGERAVITALLPSGQKVEIDAYGPQRFRPEASVNWSALGSCSADDARAYAEVLMHAARVAETLAPSGRFAQEQAR